MRPAVLGQLLSAASQLWSFLATSLSALVRYANTLYQFSITLTNGSWYMCAGNDQNISDEYECIKSDDAAGTYTICEQ